MEASRFILDDNACKSGLFPCASKLLQLTMIYKRVYFFEVTSLYQNRKHEQDRRQLVWKMTKSIGIHLNEPCCWIWEAEEDVRHSHYFISGKRTYSSPPGPSNLETRPKELVTFKLIISAVNSVMPLKDVISWSCQSINLTIMFMKYVINAKDETMEAADKG